MKDYAKAYKAYDIRAIYDDPIDDIFCFNLGLAIGREAVKKHGARARIIIGSDVRMWNNTLIYRFVKGLKQGGVIQVVSAGLKVEGIDEQQENRWGVCSTSLMYYFTKGDFSFGVPFTASHNPSQYVGMKIVDHNSVLMETSILKEWVGDTYLPLPGRFDQEECDLLIAELMGTSLKTILNTKYKQYLSVIDAIFARLTKPVTMVVDYVNGAGIAYERKILQDMTKKYGHTLIEINEKADAQFRAHLSDTTDPHEYKQLCEAVLVHKADAGFMFDGDADRTGLVNEKGEVIMGDLVVAALAEQYLQKSPAGSAVVYDVTSSNAIVDIIKKYKGIPIPSRVGHRFVKEKFKEHNAIFAGELSGHLFLSEVGGFESSVMAVALLLQCREQYGSFSAMQTSIMPYYKPALINYAVADVTSTLEKIKQAFKNSSQDYTDGIRIDGAGWWVLVRGSNTEPKVRFYAETRTLAQYEELKKKVEKVILG